MLLCLRAWGLASSSWVWLVLLSPTYCLCVWSGYLATNHSFLIPKMGIITPFGAVLRITWDDAWQALSTAPATWWELSKFSVIIIFNGPECFDSLSVVSISFTPSLGIPALASLSAYPSGLTFLTAAIACDWGSVLLLKECFQPQPGGSWTSWPHLSPLWLMPVVSYEGLVWFSELVWMPAAMRKAGGTLDEQGDPS